MSSPWECKHVMAGAVLALISVSFGWDNRSHLGIPNRDTFIEGIRGFHHHGRSWKHVVGCSCLVRTYTDAVTANLPVPVGIAIADLRDSGEPGFCLWIGLQLPTEMSQYHVGTSHWMTLTWQHAGRAFWRIWF